jgi:hypothetical protein
VTVNGAGIFILSGLRANEIRTVDVAGYMTSGTSNVIELSAPAGIAASATLLISDGLPAISTDPGPQFVRGDPNLDGFVDHSDPLAILEGLFLGSGGIQCQDAADINDDSRVDVTDPIVLLGYLYLGTGVNPAQPFPSCGRDTTTDDLDCAGLTACP